MGRSTTEPVETRPPADQHGETSEFETTRPEPRPGSFQEWRLARRRRREIKKLERQLLGRRPRLRRRFARRPVRSGDEDMETMLDASMTRALEQERKAFRKQTEAIIDERLKELSASWERRQRSAEKRIMAHTERSLERMAQTASKRLNREAARLRSEVGKGARKAAPARKRRS
jgi:hypothetical protein